MILVDTGFLMALVQSRDALNGRAKTWSKVLTERLVVTEYVLWETVNALSKPASRVKAHLLIEHIHTPGKWEIVSASSALFEEGLKLHASRPDKEWSLTDCISFIVMGGRGISRALAYDRHFEQAGFEALLRRDPP